MLTPEQKRQFYFGPYQTPRFEIGDIVWDEVRGEVEIVGVSDGPIPWPIGRWDKAKSPVIYADLARAIRHESRIAVRHWFRLSSWCHNRARRALKVPATNEGTRRLLQLAADTPAFKNAQRKGLLRCGSPDIRERSAAARRGKCRPDPVRQKISESLRGQARSADHCRNLSRAHRRRGTRPPNAGRPWTIKENAWLHTLPIAEVARRTNRTLNAVYNQRRLLGLTRRRPTRTCHEVG